MALPLSAAALGLAQFAPSIARWLGGENAEKIASTVVDLGKKITGVDDSLIMIQALKENPALVIDFQRATIQLESELEYMYLADRQNARARDVSMTQAGRINFRADIMVLCAAAGLISDKVSLGFVAATEDQVCKHLNEHLEQLPAQDEKSRAILEQMRIDEEQHAESALNAGGFRFPAPVKFGMSLMAKVMTKSTYRI